MEVLKPRIEARHQAWQKAMEARQQRRSITPPSRPQSRSRMNFAASDPAVAGNSTTLAAHEHGDLAVQLARSEIRRRDTARRATRMAGVSQQEEQKRRVAGLWDSWDYGTPKAQQPVEEDACGGEWKKHGEESMLHTRVEETFQGAALGKQYLSPLRLSLRRAQNTGILL